LPETFYWHDYETWGTDPRRDRPAQFAGLRTDLELNAVSDELVLFCRPSTDLLPQPDACLITGITPLRAQREGLNEAAFAAAIHRELAHPGTCGVGYNSLRFDDEVSRHLFYRNLIDPYGREWRNGNSRWDLIDALRLAHALRPEGVTWPESDDGSTSFRLEALTAANGIRHGAAAHDALADVRATVELARLLKDKQPRLFGYALSLRDKRRVQALLEKATPLLHVSARYPATLGCVAPVLPVAPHPRNANGVLVFDLRQDPANILDLSSEQIHERLFTPNPASSDEARRFPVKTLHVNRAPVLAPLSTLTGDAAARWAIDTAQVKRHAAKLQQAADLRTRLVEAHSLGQQSSPKDPDLMLYSGGFICDADRKELERLRHLAPEALAGERSRLKDPRLPDMLWRYRARNWPESLSEEERADWDAFRLARLTEPEAGGGITLDGFEQRLAELREAHTGAPDKLAVLDELEAWAEYVMDTGD